MEHLSKSGYESFMSNFSQSDIMDLIDWMEVYADAFVNCTSLYSSYISRVGLLAQSAFDLASRELTFGETFNYEVVSEVILEMRFLILYNICLNWLSMYKYPFI